MSDRARIEEAKPWHVDRFMPDIGGPDLYELVLSNRRPPRDVVLECVNSSTHAFAGFIDGRLAVLWGAAPVSLVGGVAAPWMVSTVHLELAPRLFLRHCREQVRVLSDVYPRLENHVHARHAVAIRWLRWLGFSFGDAVPLGPYSEPFLPFLMRRD